LTPSKTTKNRNFSIRNQQVAGSSPASSSIEKTLDFPKKIGVFLFSVQVLFRLVFRDLAHVWRTIPIFLRFWRTMGRGQRKNQAADLGSVAWSLCR
jgi:hypothetical protein